MPIINMPEEDKKLISQIKALHNKFLLELNDLEKRRQEILAAQRVDNTQNYTDKNTKLH